MSYQPTLTLLESLVPAIIGGTLALLAIFGIRELMKETKLAFK